MIKPDYIEHVHCYHPYHGSIMMVIPDGHIIQKCCKCEAMRTVHVDHIFDHCPQPYKKFRRTDPFYGRTDNIYEDGHETWMMRPSWVRNTPRNMWSIPQSLTSKDL